MDRSDKPPRPEPSRDQPERKRRGSPLVFLIVLAGVALFLFLLSPMMEPHAAPARSLAATAPKTGPVQPSWQRQPPRAGADAGAP